VVFHINPPWPPPSVGHYRILGFDETWRERSMFDLDLVRDHPGPVVLAAAHATYVARLKDRHRRKRNFTQLLE